MPVREDKKVEWEKMQSINQDSYGKAICDIAAKAMDLLDTPEHTTIDTHALIRAAEDAVGEGGITGYMAGAIAQIISTFHTRGQEFADIWNAPYGIPAGTPGTVNPAILTIKGDS